jgi:hypothetical protein
MIKTTVPHLASKPHYDVTKNAVEFDFWEGSQKRHATVTMTRTAASEVMDLFNANWPMIGDMASRTPPNKDGVIEIKVKF